MGVFFALSLLVLAESATPTGASGEQSSAFSAWAASIINILFPGEPAKPYAPSELKVSSNILSYKDEDGKKVLLYDEDKAVVGTTRMFTYTLSYPEEASLFTSQVDLVEVACPGKDSYSKTVNTSTNGGAIRIIPLVEGQYSFLLKDAGGHEEKIEFECVNRLSPKEISSPLESYTVSIGESKNFPYALSFGDYERSDESVHHYLCRFVNPTLAEFSSSNESIFTVSNGGLIKGVSSGEADLLFNGEKVSTIKVEGTYEKEDIASISLSADSGFVSPLDYDYSKLSYGVKLTPHFYNSLGNEFTPTKTPALRYESEDHLIAMVENDRYEMEKVDEKEVYTYKEGGFVAGYRNKGKTNIRCYLEENPSVSAKMEITSKEVPPSSVSFSFQSNKKAVEDASEVVAGNSIEVLADFLPANCGDKSVHVDLSDGKIGKVLNNDTNTPQVNLLSQGDLTISVYSNSLGEATKKSIAIKVAPKPAIPESEMGDFSSFIRKAAGHLALFAFTATFGAIGLFLSDSYKNKKEMLILFAAFLFFGFALAGISELIQALPMLSRGASITDVGIDFLGYSVAAVLVFVIFFIIRIIKDKKEKEGE